MARPARDQPILVGVDGSSPSLRALGVAADLAADLHDTELVVAFAHYVPLAMPPDVAENMYADVLDEAEQKLRASVADVLSRRSTALVDRA
jgi:nucleotide-binding universal stress UspA family protein